MIIHVRSARGDGRVLVRILVGQPVAEALHDEALRRRQSASVVADIALRRALPDLAAEHVRDHLLGQSFQLVTGDSPEADEPTTSGPEAHHPGAASTRSFSDRDDPTST